MSFSKVCELLVIYLSRWINRQKSWLKYFIAMGAAGHLLANLLLSGMFLYASARNYPGGDALAHLQVTFLNTLYI